MKIEVGKRYIDAEGFINNIVEKDNNSMFISAVGETYFSNGGYDRFTQTPQDLICEVVPEIMAAWKEGDINSWKDVLEAHIDWWTLRK